MTPPPDPAVLTVKETAAILRVSPSHVYRMIEAGEIPALRIGGTVRVSRAWLDRFVAGVSATPLANVMQGG